MKSKVHVTSDAVIAKWLKYKLHGGFETDDQFAEHLLTSEENRLKVEENDSSAPIIKNEQDVLDQDLTSSLSSQPANQETARTEDYRIKTPPKNGVRRFTCQFCPLKFKQDKYLSRHVRLKHANVVAQQKDQEPKIADDELRNFIFTEFKCKQCGKKLHNRRSYQIHLMKHADPAPYDCEICGEKFKMKRFLHDHYKTHSESEILLANSVPLDFVCDDCGKKLGDRRSYLNHIALAHSNQTPFGCSLCDEQFKLRQYLQMHFRKVHPEHPVPQKYQRHQTDDSSKFVCTICGKSVKTRKSYEAHMQLKHSEATPHECELCGAGFKINTYLQKHYRERHPGINLVNQGHAQDDLTIDSMARSIPDDLVCELCGKKLCDKRGYQMHIKITHSTRMPHVCEVCGEKFKILKYLTVHYNKFHPEFRREKREREWKERDADSATKLPHQCSFCARRFKSHKSLSFHLSKVCNKEKYALPPDLICPLCGKQLKDRKGFRQHAATAHATEAPFECGVCGRKFKLEPYLKSHMLKHSGRRDFVCGLCGKRFYSKTILAIHERNVHSGLTFPCDTCGKTYTSAEGLKDHSRLHTGDTFMCDICGRGFLRQKAMSEHRLVAHYGQTKSFECGQCDSRFSFSSSLQSHLKQKHSATPFEKRFTCEVCGKKFVKAWDLKEHANTHTGAKPYKCEICQRPFHTLVSKRNHAVRCKEKQPGRQPPKRTEPYFAPALSDDVINSSHLTLDHPNKPLYVNQLRPHYVYPSKGYHMIANMFLANGGSPDDFIM